MDDDREELLLFQRKLAIGMLDERHHDTIFESPLLLKCFCGALNGTNFEYYKIIGKNYIYELVFLKLYHELEKLKEKERNLNLEPPSTAHTVETRNRLFEVSVHIHRGLKMTFDALDDPTFIESKELFMQNIEIAKKNINKFAQKMGMDEGGFKRMTKIHQHQHDYELFYDFITRIIDIFKHRYLTEDELNYIVSGINYPIKGKFPLVTTVVQNSLREDVKDKLRDNKLVPFSIKPLKDKIEKSFLSALISTGSTVGMISSEAIVTPLMQKAISSFSDIGGSNSVHENLADIKSVLNSNGKNESVFIGFSSREFSFDDALKFRSEIEEVTFGYFVLGDPEMIVFDDKEEEYEEFIQELNDNLNQNLDFVKRRSRDSSSSDESSDESSSNSSDESSDESNEDRRKKSKRSKKKTDLKKKGKLRNNGETARRGNDVKRQREKISLLGKKGIRIKLNKYKMIDRDVSITDLVCAILNPDLSPNYYVFFSKFNKSKLPSDPYIDIYYKDFTHDDHFFLSRETYPSISSLYIKGVSSVKNVEIREFAVSDLFTKETHTREGDTLLWFDQAKIQTHCIDRERIRTMLESVCNFQEGDYEIVEKTYYNMKRNTLTSPLNFLSQNHVNPFLICVKFSRKGIEKLMERSKKLEIAPSKFSILGTISAVSLKVLSDYIEYEREQIRNHQAKSSKEIVSNYFDFYYIKMQAKVSSLFEIFLCPEVCPYSTFYNDAKKTFILLGIGSAEWVSLREILRIIGFSPEKFINPSNMLICAKYMTNPGEVTNINYKGASMHEDPPFTLAATEKALSTLIKSSIEGSKESLINYHSAVIFGKTLKIGSESVKVEPDELELKKFKKTIDREDAGEVTDLERPADNETTEQEDLVEIDTKKLQYDKSSLEEQEFVTTRTGAYEVKLNLERDRFREIVVTAFHQDQILKGLEHEGLSFSIATKDIKMLVERSEPIDIPMIGTNKPYRTISFEED